MRIAIVTSGRFHVCELARELAILGRDVQYYSIVPPCRTRKFGLPHRCNRSLLPQPLPWYAAARCARRTSFVTWADEHFLSALDRTASSALEHCDVLIGMSGM